MKVAVLDMGGVQMGPNNQLVIHKAVDVEDTREGQNKPQEGKGKEAV